MTAFPFGELVEEDNVVTISVTWEVIFYTLRLLPQVGNAIKLCDATIDVTDIAEETDLLIYM